jgi:predicted GTPase
MKDNQYKEVFETAFEEIQEENEQLKSVNILLTGKSGVGKSTLINTVFGEELANTGVGKPITDKIKLIEVPGFPVRLYDTVGFEKEKSVEISDKLLNHLRAMIFKN